MNNQQVPKADSKFQKIVRANHKKWKLRLLSKGGQKSDSGGGPYKEKPDYKMGKSAPDMIGEKQLNEIIKQELEKALLEEGFLDDVVSKGKELYQKFTSMFSGDVKSSANLEGLVNKYNIDPKSDLSLGRKELQDKFGGFEGYIEFLWKMFDENKSSLSGWSRDKTIELIKQIAPKYGVEPYIIIGTMMGESGGMPVGIYSQTMSSRGNPQAAISANSTAYGMGQIVHSTYESVKNQVGVPHYMIWIPEYGIEATIALISKLIKQRGSLEAAMASYAGSSGGGERKLAAIEKAKEQYGSLAESKKKGKDDRCVRIAKRKYKAWPSAYASGAVVKCRQGKIWKNIKEEEELDETKKKAKHTANKALHTANKALATGLAGLMAVLPPSDTMKPTKKPPVSKKHKEELEEELERIEGIFGTTLEDDFKIQAITEHIKDYRSWELEELLKNGKQYLKK